ncbi:MAG: Gfo/Idh/MocA family protein [Planctomycetota bacterium]|jgi:predicted dehydrogenase
MSAVGIGAIGCGGRVLGVMKRIPGIGKDIEVRALCDVSARSIEQAREAVAPEAKVYEDYRELVRDPGIDWVMVGSWNCFHREHAVAALEAGKHVFCEKPMATTLEDCLAMRDAWRASDRIFSVGFVLRYSPHYQAIREVVRSGEIGRIVSMEFNETLGPDHGAFIHMDWRRKTKWAGSHLLEKCCHDLDLASWIVGSLPARVASFGGLDLFSAENAAEDEFYPRDGKGRNPFRLWPKSGMESIDTPFSDDKDIIDNQVAIIEYASGVRATFHTNCSTAIRERRMYICGTRGTIRGDVISGQLQFKKVSLDRGEPERLDTGVSGGHGGADGTLSASLRESIVNGAPPLADPVDGLVSAATAFAVDQAMESGKVVSLAPTWKRAGLEPREARSCGKCSGKLERAAG